MTKSIIPYDEDELKQLSNVELLLAVKTLNMTTKSMSKFIKNNHHNPILDEVLFRTKFLDESIKGFVPILARLYCLEHDLKSHPTCHNPECDHIVEWRHRLHRFAPYCSMVCRDADPEFQKKKEQGMLAKHGVTNSMKLDWVREKARKTNLERRGVEYATQSDEVKEKTKRTNRERHGVDYVFQSEEFKRKSEKTCEIKYGVKHPCQNPNILEKQKQTFIEHYGTHPMKTKEGVEKVEKTMMERHGVRNAFQLESVREKLKEANISRHGVESMLELSEIRELGKQKMMDNYGVDTPSKLDWVKDRIRNAHLSKETIDKTICTCRKKYGVDWYQQTEEYHKRAHKRYTNPKYPGMSFSTTWEFKVYDFLVEHKIPFEYQIEPIPYEYDGETHYYFPDFRVNGRIFEVKGDNFFRINKETGKEEMYCTWRRPGISDDEYKKICEKEEAKHQCMIANNVRILRGKDIKSLSVDMFQ